MVLLPLLLIVVGIVQFGLMLNANVTLTNAAREGAREGSIHKYEKSAPHTPATNDIARCNAIVAATKNALGMLTASSPNFVTGASCTGSGNIFTNGDVRVEYVKPSAVPVNSARQGYQMTVTVTYRQDIIVPLIGDLLFRDAGGRFVHTAKVTMVVN